MTASLRDLHNMDGVHGLCMSPNWCNGDFIPNILCVRMGCPTLCRVDGYHTGLNATAEAVYWPIGVKHAMHSKEKPAPVPEEPEAEGDPLGLEGFQREVHFWIIHNFGEQSDLVLYGGTAEEVGEVLRGAVKREQGIRGTREEWDAEIKKEMGDVVIKLASIAGKEGWSLEKIIQDRWADVSKRDWVKDNIGHGIAE